MVFGKGSHPQACAPLLLSSHVVSAGICAEPSSLQNSAIRYAHKMVTTFKACFVMSIDHVFHKTMFLEYRRDLLK